MRFIKNKKQKEIIASDSVKKVAYKKVRTARKPVIADMSGCFYVGKLVDGTEFIWNEKTEKASFDNVLVDMKAEHLYQVAELYRYKPFNSK